MSLYLAQGLTSYSKELHENTLNAYGGIARSRCGYTAGQNIGQNLEFYKRSQALWFVSKSKQPLLTWHHGLQLPEHMQSRGRAFRLFRADVSSSDCIAAKNEDGIMGLVRCALDAMSLLHASPIGEQLILAADPLHLSTPFTRSRKAAERSSTELR